MITNKPEVRRYIACQKSLNGMIEAGGKSERWVSHYVLEKDYFALQAECVALVEALEEARRELNSCQSVIHYAGGFDPAYVTGAQAALVKIDAALDAFREGVQP